MGLQRVAEEEVLANVTERRGAHAQSRRMASQAKSGGWLMAAAHFFDLIYDGTGPYRRRVRTHVK